ncbi:hypothetical protein SAMN05421505_111189 [Sinosporangium album]|uniref:Uncharacterized protein n=1 Tax=Sinosporangium album TaxID=504805 RepID=A0A1G7ZUF7_9ACTN|nr:hypothetical protein [Sinosporangium album]SDH11790.1 hypothetical protein SAMN05421505_111189 [Sinosporangium album]
MDALVGGTSFVPTADGWLVHTPQGDFLTVELDREHSGPLDALLSAEGEAGAELVAALTEEGVLAAPAPAVPEGDLLVYGDGPLLDVLPPLLAGLGLPVRAPARSTDLSARDLSAGDLAEPSGVAALVVVTACLRDTRLLEIDGLCRTRGLPWHLGYAEGRRWYTGPFHTSPGTASYRDLRLRRLAASPWPRELAAHWAWLDRGGVPHPDPAAPIGAHLAAAFIAADLRAHLHGETPYGVGLQIGADPVTGEIRRHPVLPVPTDLLMASAP